MQSTLSLVSDPKPPEVDAWPLPGGRCDRSHEPSRGGNGDSALGRHELDEVFRELAQLRERLAECEATSARCQELLNRIVHCRAYRAYLLAQRAWAGLRQGPIARAIGKLAGKLRQRRRFGSLAAAVRNRSRRALAHLWDAARTDAARRRAAARRAMATAVAEVFAGTPPDGPLAVPPSASPLVSIVLPVHNQWEHTLWCLRSIVANSGDVPYEVIVADDASTDATQDIETRVANVRVVRRSGAAGPLGFLKNCNAAAGAAAGKYLLFLNNDTLVKQGWLQALVDVAESDERVGLAGCKLLFPDGTLQEAGGIIWRDASGNNYGRGQAPGRPEFNYVRETDYVSGAAMLVRRSLWDEIGGFDERFAPAYYEDADLAFEARRRGYRVVYQPAAEVVHFEGVSHGTQIDRGIKQHQAINQRRFAQKWQGVLERDHRPPHADFFLARHGRHGPPPIRALVFDGSLPTPDRDAGSLRMAGILSVLASCDCQVTLFPLLPPTQPQQPYLRQFQQQGVFVADGSGQGAGFLDAFLHEHGRYFDLVIVSRVLTGVACMERVRRSCPQALVVFDTVDLHFLREQRRAEFDRDEAGIIAAQRTKQQELGLMRQADLTLVVSPFEADLLRREVPGAPVRILSTIHAVHDRGQPFAARRDLLFIGDFLHRPNLDAIQWFVPEVFPEIRRRLPGVRLYLIGDHRAQDLWKLASADVRLLGHVADLEPYLRSCRLSVAPVRYGAGVKGKINMSMSYGLPVVSTTIGCEGMFLQDGVDVLVADEAPAMADAVCRLYEDEALWERLSRAGVDNVARHFSFEAARRSVREILALCPRHG
jgi:GT2 family glycosyltransferase